MVSGGQQSDTQSGQQSGQQKLIVEDYKNEVLKFCIEPKTAVEIKNMLKIKSRHYISSNIIKPLIDDNKLEYTNKNSINIPPNCLYNNIIVYLK